MKKKSISFTFGHYIELIIVFFLIILNVFDLLEYMSPTFDYIDKISGIIGIAFLVYLVSPTKILLGKKEKILDFLLILFFVFMIFNKVTTSSIATYESLYEKAPEIIMLANVQETVDPQFTISVPNINQLTSTEFNGEFYKNILNSLSFYTPVVYFSVTDGINSKILAATTPAFSWTNISNYLDGSLFFMIKWLVLNDVLAEKIAFYIGAIGLIALALYIAWKKKISAPSFLHVLHGDRKRFQWKPLRAGVILLVFCFFFLFIFQLMVEWLGVVIDAPIAFLGVLFYVVLMIRYRHFFKTSSLITKIGETGEEFYEKFIALFHTPYGIALGMSGIFILHILTDFGIYIISYIFYQHEMLYFDVGSVFFSEHHTPLFSVLNLFGIGTSLFVQDITTASTIFNYVQILWIYVFNISAILFLFLAPAYIWYILVHRKKAHEKEWMLVISFIALTVYAAFPLFHIGMINSSGIVGADITTSSIKENNAYLTIEKVIVMSALIGLGIYGLSFKKWIRRDLVYVSFIAALVYLAIYMYYYYVGVLLYYYTAILSQFAATDWLILFYLIIFSILSML
ncbi:MAG: hypothetical protein WC254_04985, partial [Candidatus Woesearchaeota archaeon]